MTFLLTIFLISIYFLGGIGFFVAGGLLQGLLNLGVPVPERTKYKPFKYATLWPFIALKWFVKMAIYLVKGSSNRV